MTLRDIFGYVKLRNRACRSEGAKHAGEGIISIIGGITEKKMSRLSNRCANCVGGTHALRVRGIYIQFCLFQLVKQLFLLN